MAPEWNFLGGDINDDPSGSEKDVERLLMGFLEALQREQRGVQPERDARPAAGSRPEGASPSESGAGPEAGA